MADQGVLRALTHVESRSECSKRKMIAASMLGFLVMMLLDVVLG